MCFKDKMNINVTKLGLTFIVKDRADLFWYHVNRNRWENQTFRIFRQFIRPGSVYLDIGAWIGPTVLFGASISGRCFAAEPDPVAFAELKANVELNPELSEKVTLFNGCLAQTTGRVRFGTPSAFGDSCSSLLFSDRASIEVEALRFEDFLLKYRIKECGFIKMDIEGGETLVLPTMKDFLATQTPALYLSLHQKLFRDRAADLKRIADVLRIYPYIYRSDGLALDAANLETYLLGLKKTEVLCLKSPWPLAGLLRHRMSGFLDRLHRKLRWLFMAPAQH